MELKLGESKTFKLPIWLKAVDMIHEKNGLRLERQRGGIVCLNVNNGSRRIAYAAIPLGAAKDLNEFGFTVKAQSKTRMLFSVGAVKFVIDYAAKKVSTNLIGLRVFGSKEWGDNVQTPWRAEYMPLFGLPLPPLEMDQNTAKLFWQWFYTNETDIDKMLNGSKKESKSVYQQIDLWLCPVFPYSKSSRIDFEVKCKDGDNTFIFRHGGDEKLMEDAAVFGTLMPENMAKRWNYIVEE